MRAVEETERVCPDCGVIFSRKRYVQRTFCSYPCAMRSRRQSVEDRFRLKVVNPDSDGCRIWNGTIDKGYGVFMPDCRRDVPGARRLVAAHRWAFEQTHGPLLSNEILHHICRTPLCVNPAHLQIVTRAWHINHHRGDLVRAG